MDYISNIQTIHKSNCTIWRGGLSINSMSNALITNYYYCPIYCAWHGPKQRTKISYLGTKTNDTCILVERPRLFSTNPYDSTQPSMISHIYTHSKHSLPLSSAYKTNGIFTLRDRIWNGLNVLSCNWMAIWIILKCRVNVVSNDYFTIRNIANYVVHLLFCSVMHISEQYQMCACVCMARNKEDGKKGRI